MFNIELALIFVLLVYIAWRLNDIESKISKADDADQWKRLLSLYVQSTKSENKS